MQDMCETCWTRYPPKSWKDTYPSEFSIPWCCPAGVWAWVDRSTNSFFCPEPEGEPRWIQDQTQPKGYGMLWVQIIEHLELPFWPLAIGDCKGDPRESLQVRLARDEKYLEALLLDGHICSNYGYAIWFSWDCCKPSSYGISAHFPEIPALNLWSLWGLWGGLHRFTNLVGAEEVLFLDLVLCIPFRFIFGYAAFKLYRCADRCQEATPETEGPWLALPW